MPGNVFLGLIVNLLQAPSMLRFALRLEVMLVRATVVILLLLPPVHWRCEFVLQQKCLSLKRAPGPRKKYEKSSIQLAVVTVVGGS